MDGAVRMHPELHKKKIKIKIIILKQNNNIALFEHTLDAIQNILNVPRLHIFVQHVAYTQHSVHARLDMSDGGNI